MLDVVCPGEDRMRYLHKIDVKHDIHLVIVPVEMGPDWLAEVIDIFKLVNGKTMQLGFFCAHAAIIKKVKKIL